MTGLALTLVLLSALAHASWNFLLKRYATSPEVFIWLLQFCISVLFLPLGAVLAWQTSVDPLGWWWLLGTIVLHILYFLLLGRGYTYADLSVVYPIARGFGPALVPVLGVLVLDESITSLAVVGIIGVVAGIYTIYWWGNLALILRDPLRLLKEPGSRAAVATGLIIATYSIWDKVGVRYINPLLYMYLMSLGTFLGITPFVLKKYSLSAIRGEWHASAPVIVVAALLTFAAYGMVLTALDFSRVSYVAPSREVGIVIGVLLGTLILKEPFGRGRLLGSGFILVGLGLIAVAP